MKKHILLALYVFVTLILASSCEKEGVYSPEKKISKIYVEGSWKRLQQEWTWKGDLLQSVSYYDGPFELRFQYDGKQLISITKLDKNNMYYFFHYNKSGKQLDSLDVYVDNLNQTPNVQHYAHYDFLYNDEGLISGYEEKVYYLNLYKEDEQALALALQCAVPGLPEVAAQQLAKTDTRNKGDEFGWDKYSVSFSYNGENVAECLVTINDLYKQSYTFTYTDYQNPSYRLFQSTSFESSSLYSRNLVKTCHYEEHFMGDPTYDYYMDTEYLYEIAGQYPVKATRNNSYHYYESPDYSETYTTIYYYEYK